ncbi:MAG: PKD domain-containing protein [Bacteroidetes bacterium]|nr:MAG: PKD domain-containing protein [Bacteroidota bacterium]
MFEDFVEQAGYDAKLAEYFHFFDLGLDDHTLIVGFPSAAHRDSTEYCPGKPSELFANMYEPIWDGGANGTPVNENNYYALYLWKLVQNYGDYVRFWEIWNEPGFDFTGGLGWLPPGADGNWWENNPDPCDYKLRAPIFHYIRLLRISWEIIKSESPEDYIVVSGTGYPAFLDAILRNTDNPADGSPTADFPLKGGAYFDVMGYHAYPHFDGSLRKWDDDLNDFVYARHSDAAVEGLLATRDTFQQVLAAHGYDGSVFPKKLWMITEVNLPRKPFKDYIGSAEAQRNFVIKAVATLMRENFLQMHIYKLAEDQHYDHALMEFDLMGLYKALDYNGLYFQELNEEGIAYKTVSDLLFQKTFDPDRTAQLNLPPEAGGGAFRDLYGNYTYVLWAKTTTDQSEAAQLTWSFPDDINLPNLVRREWNDSYAPNPTTVSSQNIELTGTPVFLTERLFDIQSADNCAPFQAQLTPTLPVSQDDVDTWIWVIEGGTPVTSTVWNPELTLFEPGDYSVTLEVLLKNGETLRQTDHIWVMESPKSGFESHTSGPIVRFTNLSTPAAESFVWDFGDGNTSTAPNPTHVYAQSGTYMVQLTVSNACGTSVSSHPVTVVVPSSTMISKTANDTVPPPTGFFKPATSMEFYNGWTEKELADIVAGNPDHFPKGAGIKSLRTIAGEALLDGFGYDYKLPEYQYFENLDLRDNAFLLDFPSEDSRDPNFYCPDRQSGLFRDLYLDIWDGGANGTPVNDENPFAVYVYNTVKTYKDHVQFWEVLHGPDFDFTGEWGWLPPGEPGNWWENDPDPCQYLLGAPVYYYVRLLRITYEIVHTYDPDAQVVMAGIAYESFLDAVLRNTDNPLDGSVQAAYPNKGGAYFDALSFKSYPHIDGSTIFFDVTQGNFVLQRHSDAAAGGLARVKAGFESVLKNHGYDGQIYPEKNWMVSEANVPRKSFGDFFGSAELQRNWVIKAWVEAVRNHIHRLTIHRLGELGDEDTAEDPFQMMGLFRNLSATPPYTQVPNDEAIALATTSRLLYGTTLDTARTAALNLPDHMDGAAFRDADGHYIYVLWAKTATDGSEFAAATYDFPPALGYDSLYQKDWFYSVTEATIPVPATGIELTGTPVFLTETLTELQPPVAWFDATSTTGCPGLSVQFTDRSLHQPTHFNWTFEGGTPATSADPNPVVTYPTAGTFSVSLEVSNAAGAHTQKRLGLVTVNPEPVAGFSWTTSGTTVSFVNSSEHGDSFWWDFGNGQSGIGVHPVFDYQFNGTYEVTLVAFNECGTDTLTQVLTLESAPQAAFSHTAPADCDSLAVVFLDGSTGNPDTWHWTFEGANIATSDSQFPTVIFDAPGTYSVSLSVGNDFGMSDTTLLVYIEGATTTEQDFEVCEGTMLGGVWVEKDTTFAFSLTTQNLGCDSTIIAHVSVKNTLETFLGFEVCAGTPWDGIPVWSDTVFVENYSAVSGCDSMVYIEITVLENVETTQTISLCRGDFFHGVLIQNDTLFTENLVGQNGCDSLAKTFVVALETYEIFLTDTIQMNETYAVGDSVFSATGFYSVPLTATNGCDSLVHLDLFVKDDVATGDRPTRTFSGQVFPNPFNDLVSWTFELPRAAPVRLSVYDTNGREMEQVVDHQWMSAGRHRITRRFTELAPGVYLGKMTAGESVWVFRIIKMSP